MLTDEQKKYVMWAFDSIDGRKTGSIASDKETVLEAVRLSGLNPSEADIDQLVRGQDFGSMITKDEFLSLMSRMVWKSQDETKYILLDDLEIFTNQHPGIITKDELMYVLTREGRERITVDEAKHVLDKLHIDPDGNISIDELIDTLLAVTPI